MKKFTYGVITGISSLAVAVPLLAGVAGAESDGTSSSAPVTTVPTQACVEAQADLIDVRLSSADEWQAKHQSLMQEHANALHDVAAISDETNRKAALGELRDSMRDQRASGEALPEEVQTAMDAVKDACGNEGFGMGIGGGKIMNMRMGRGMHEGFGLEGKGPMHETILEQFDMTEEELQAAFDEGKTIREIAAEKGVELPAGRMGGRGGKGIWQGGLSDTSVSDR